MGLIGSISPISSWLKFSEEIMNSQHQARRSSSLYATGILILMMLLIASTRIAFAQERSKDRDNPTPITSNELSDDLDGSNDEYFYKFSAGPGKVTITFEVTASGTNAGAHLDLFGVDARSILTDVLAQGVDSGSERVVRSIQVGRLREIVMRIKGIRYGDNGGNGVYKVRLDGAVSFMKADAPKATPSPDAPGTTPSPESPRTMASPEVPKTPSPDVPKAMPSPDVYKVTPSPDAPKATPASFAGCWTFSGKGSFARGSLGCFRQEGERVIFEASDFEGTVTGNTLRFALKSGTTTTVFAYRSGHFVMDVGGKSFSGSVNNSLNPDDDDYPLTAKYDRPAAIVDKD